MLRKVFTVLGVTCAMLPSAFAFEDVIHEMGCEMLIAKGHYVSFRPQQCAELDEKYAVLRSYGGIFDHPHHIEDLRIDTEKKMNDYIDVIMTLMTKGYPADAIHLVEDIAQPDNMVWERPAGQPFNKEQHRYMNDMFPRSEGVWQAAHGNVRENLKQLIFSSARLRAKCFRENRMPDYREVGILFDRALAISEQLLIIYNVR